MDPRTLEAVVFDLDGVVTRTARLHFAAWKAIFDEVLRRAGSRAASRRPFDEADYRAYVDGRPRLDGVRAFLGARGLALPEGDPADPRDADTVHALGRRKDARFRMLLDLHGVEVDGGAVALARALRAAGVRVGLATSSRNAAAVLRRALLDDLFEVRVDGVAAAELGLRGKPAPDLFVACARRLGAAPARAAVVEDAVVGVAAARAGGFGLVVGVGDGGQAPRLRDAGADLVVADLGALSPAILDGALAARLAAAERGREVRP